MFSISRPHELKNLSNRGNFHELLHFYAERYDNVGSIVANQQMVVPSIQKDIVLTVAKEIICHN